jgi:hypothetical protein
MRDATVLRAHELVLALAVDVTVRAGVHHAFVEFAEALKVQSIRLAQQGGALD